MAIYLCLCEDEWFKQNCSQECDLCTFGQEQTQPLHTDDEDNEVGTFIQLVDIHLDSVYVPIDDYKKDPFLYIDGTTMAIHTITAPLCPWCRVQPAGEDLSACPRCLDDAATDAVYQQQIEKELDRG